MENEYYEQCRYIADGVLGVLEMKRILVIISLFFLCISVHAAIPVAVTETGCTYIQWNWTPGLTLTDMFLDGNVLCGYETTDSGFLATGLSSGELHNLTIITAGNSGTNITRTTTENCTAPGGGGKAYLVEQTPLNPAIPLMAVASVMLLYMIRRKP
jgi:hypothetical protein